MQKKCLLILIGLALGIKAADGEQKNRFVDALRLYTSKQIGIKDLKEQLATYTQDELSNPDKDSLTPLMRSVEHPCIVRMLLDYGADPRIQVDGQDVLTFTFQKAYVEGDVYSKMLDLLKNHMGITSEEDAFSHALKQGMVFTQKEKHLFMIFDYFCFWEKNRDYELVGGFIFQPDGYLIKGGKKK